MKSEQTFLIVAGGTGGHIFPALQVAHEMMNRGCKIIWVGSENSMEVKIVSEKGISMEFIRFKGVRGKGFLPWLALPFTLLRAMMDSFRILMKISPNGVLVMGGYLSLPVGLMSFFFRRPLILHEQNSCSGLANRVLSFFATRVLTAFPNVLRRGEEVGNPIPSTFLKFPPPAKRYSLRGDKPLQIFVVGGSLGSTFLNQILPKALALLPKEKEIKVLHQTGERHINEVKRYYSDQKSIYAEVTLLAFVKDMACAYAEADLLICRAGAMTVAEIASIGVAALFVPYPYAVDDHQTSNAKWLVEVRAADLIQQSELTPERLAVYLNNLSRELLSAKAERGRILAKFAATRHVADICMASTSLRKI